MLPAGWSTCFLISFSLNKNVSIKNPSRTVKMVAFAIVHPIIMRANVQPAMKLMIVPTILTNV